MNKKKLLLALLAIPAFFGVVSCSNDVPNVPTESSAPVQYFDNPATNIDHYFSNQVTFASTRTQLDPNGSFIQGKVAKLKLKSVTDGDTAVFHLNNEEDTYTVAGKSYSDLTVRFLSIDTPESTSGIDPWGKAASNYVKDKLYNASGIIVDASDLDNERYMANRLDSNGTRWLGLIWYAPKDTDPDDLNNYRLLELDVIEECYSRFTGLKATNTRYAYNANEQTEPLLYSRYSENWGSLSIADLLFEAENRMSATGKRKFGEVDPNYDYSKEPKEVTIANAIENFDEYSSKGTFVSVTGVITSFIGPNFYIQDGESALYIYMGIDGKSINKMFKVGDTIDIRGRLAEYGGQKQMSGIVFAEDTFTKLTGDKALPMPEAVELTGNETIAELEALVGRLVKSSLTISSVGKESKDKSYTMYSSNTIPGLGGSYNTMSIRINGSLAPGYDRDEMEANYKGKTVSVYGVMSVYLEMDAQLTENYPSYQIVVGNRAIVDGVVQSDIK